MCDTMKNKPGLLGLYLKLFFSIVKNSSRSLSSIQIGTTCKIY